MIFAYWHISPPIRDRYVFLLIFALPIYGLRWLAHRRLFTGTALDLFFLLFVQVSIYNFHHAPWPRADYLVVACRYFLGIFMVFYFVEHARQHQHLRYLTLATICLGILISLVALVASQWTATLGKWDILSFVTDHLPRLDSKRILPDMLLSFNPNEIAGAVSYFCPFMLAVAIGSFAAPHETEDRPLSPAITSLLRWGSLLGFALSLSALILSQSRSALAGAAVTILIVLALLLLGRKFRRIAMALLGLLALSGILLILTAIISGSNAWNDTGNYMNFTHGAALHLEKPDIDWSRAVTNLQISAGRNDESSSSDTGYFFAYAFGTERQFGIGDGQINHINDLDSGHAVGFDHRGNDQDWSFWYAKRAAYQPEAYADITPVNGAWAETIWRKVVYLPDRFNSSNIINFEIIKAGNRVEFYAGLPSDTEVTLYGYVDLPDSNINSTDGRYFGFFSSQAPNRFNRLHAVAIGNTDAVETIDLASLTPRRNSLNALNFSLRDQNVVEIRFQIWDRALRIIQDYPATGSGISTYRSMVTFDKYRVPYYANKILPHAHNAFLQMGADLGVMGLFLFLAWYGTVTWMAVQSFRGENRHARTMAVAIAAGIVAHMIYALNDAIPFWDRFAFTHWWFIGLMTALYILKRPTGSFWVRALQS